MFNIISHRERQTTPQSAAATHPAEQLTLKDLTSLRVGECVKSSARVVGMLNGATTVENWQLFVKLNVCALWPVAPFLGIYTREMFIYVPKTNNKSRNGTRVTMAALLPLAKLETCICQKKDGRTSSYSGLMIRNHGGESQTRCVNHESTYCTSSLL